MWLKLTILGWIAQFISACYTWNPEEKSTQMDGFQLISNLSATDLSISMNIRDLLEYPIEMLYGSHPSPVTSTVAYKVQLQLMDEQNSELKPQDWIRASIVQNRNPSNLSDTEKKYFLQIESDRVKVIEHLGEYKKYCLLSFVYTNTKKVPEDLSSDIQSCLPVHLRVLDSSRNRSDPESLFYGKQFTLSTIEHTTGISLDHLFLRLIPQTVSVSLKCRNTTGPASFLPKLVDYKDKSTRRPTGGFERLGDSKKTFILGLLLEYKEGDGWMKVRRANSPYALVDGVNFKHMCLRVGVTEVLEDGAVILCEGVDALEVGVLRRLDVMRGGQLNWMVSYQSSVFSGGFQSCVLTGLIPRLQDFSEAYGLYCVSFDKSSPQDVRGEKYTKFTLGLAPVRMIQSIEYQVSQYLPQILEYYYFNLSDPTLTISHLYLVSDALLQEETLYLACILNSQDERPFVVLLGLNTPNSQEPGITSIWKFNHWRPVEDFQEQNATYSSALKKHLCHCSQGVFILTQTLSNLAEVYLSQQPDAWLFYSNLSAGPITSWSTNCFADKAIFAHSSWQSTETQPDSVRGVTTVQKRYLTVCSASTPMQAETRLLISEAYQTVAGWDMLYLTTIPQTQSPTTGRATTTDQDEAPPQHTPAFCPMNSKTNINDNNNQQSESTDAQATRGFGDTAAPGKQVLVVQTVQVLQHIAGDSERIRYVQVEVGLLRMPATVVVGQAGEYRCELGLRGLLGAENDQMPVKEFRVTASKRSNLGIKTLKPPLEVKIHSEDAQISQSIDVEEYLQFDGNLFDAQFSPKGNVRDTDKVRFYPRRRTKYIIRVDEAQYRYTKLIWIQKELILAVDGPKFDILIPRPAEKPDLPQNFTKLGVLNINATSFAPEYGVLYSKEYRHFDFLEYKLYHKGNQSWIFILGITDRVDFFVGDEVSFGTIRQFVLIAANLNNLNITGAYYSGIPDGPYFKPFVGGKPYILGNITEIGPNQFDVPIGFFERATVPFDMVDFRLIRFWFWTNNNTFARVPNFSGIDDKIMVRIGTFSPKSQYMETYYNTATMHQRYVFVSLTEERILVNEIEFQDRDASMPPCFKNVSKSVLYFTDFPGDPVSLNCSLTWGSCLISLDTNYLALISFEYSPQAEMYIFERNPSAWKIYPSPGSAAFQSLWLGEKNLACHTGNPEHEVYIYKDRSLAQSYITLPPVYLQQPSISFGFDTLRFDSSENKDLPELLIQMMGVDSAVVSELSSMRIHIIQLRHEDFESLANSSITVNYPQSQAFKAINISQLDLRIPIKFSVGSLTSRTSSFWTHWPVYAIISVALVLTCGINRVWYSLRVRELQHKDLALDNTSSSRHIPIKIK